MQNYSDAETMTRTKMKIKTKTKIKMHLYYHSLSPLLLAWEHVLPPTTLPVYHDLVRVGGHEVSFCCLPLQVALWEGVSSHLPVVFWHLTQIGNRTMT